MENNNVSPVKPKGKYPNLEAALKVKNDEAREFIKHVKLPNAWKATKRVNIEEIKNEQEYELSLDRVDAIFDAKPGTPEGDELELLLLVIKAYEDEHHPVPPPDPIEAIKLTMEEKGIKATELTQRMGVSKGYVSQLLNGRKPLTASIMRLLHKQLGVSAEILLS